MTPEPRTVRHMDTATLGTRHIEATGAFNIRDLGGYRGSGGRTVRWTRLYRADGLHRVPVEGRAAVAELGWRTVLDLRTHAELEAGAFTHEGVQVVHLPVLRETWRTDGLEPDVDPVEYLLARYVEMLDEGAAAFRRSVELFAGADCLPAVFHCSAGKDRTGVLAALVLSVLGVSDDDIASDYALTAQAMDRLVDWIGQTRPDVADAMAAQPRALLSCPAEAMYETLAHLRWTHGGAEAYLRAAGVSAASLEALRHQLLS